MIGTSSSRRSSVYSWVGIGLREQLAFEDILVIFMTSSSVIGVIFLVSLGDRSSNTDGQVHVSGDAVAPSTPYSIYFPLKEIWKTINKIIQIVCLGSVVCFPWFKRLLTILNNLFWSPSQSFIQEQIVWTTACRVPPYALCTSINNLPSSLLCKNDPFHPTITIFCAFTPHIFIWMVHSHLIPHSWFT